MVRTLALSLRRVRVLSLVGEQRSRKPHSTAKKKKRKKEEEEKEKEQVDRTPVLRDPPPQR